MLHVPPASIVGEWTGTLRTWDRRYGLGPSEHQAGARARDVGNSYRLTFRAFDENFTVARHEILKIGFQHLACLLEKLLLDIGRGVLHRIATDIGKPAGEGA